MEQPLTTAELPKLRDGLIAGAIDRELRNATRDCMDRANEKAARTVTITFALTPVPGEDPTECESVNVVAAVKLSIPKVMSKAINCKPTKAGLLFNDMSPGNVNQTTFE